MTDTPLLSPTPQQAPHSSCAALRTGSPIRVVFVDHTARLGGGEIALLNLVSSFDRALVEPVIILFSEGPLADACRQRQIEVIVIPLPAAVLDARKDTLGFGSILKVRSVLAATTHVRKVAAAIRASRADIVHTNSLKGDIIGGLAGRMARRFVIWHVRDRIANDYLPRSVVILFRYLSRMIPHFIVANSSATLDTLSLPAKAANAVVPSGLRTFSQIVHDGTQTEQDSRVSDAGHPIIGLVGRIASWKGQHIFIHAAARVNARFPDARFLIVGSPLFGEHAYEQEVRSLSTSLGLDSILTFTGFREDVLAVMRSFSIAVHASTTGEPFGQVVIEAMAAACPVVATNGGGIPEIVDDRKTGILVPMGDATAMADAICEMLSNPAMAAAMGERGRERVVKEFSIEKTARTVEQLYTRLLAQPSWARFYAARKARAGSQSLD